MFELFTDEARRVIVLAQEEARLLNHNYIGTEHILLGLVRAGDSVAAGTLTRFGVSLEAARAGVESIIGHGGSEPSGKFRSRRVRKRFSNWPGAKDRISATSRLLLERPLRRVVAGGRGCTEHRERKHKSDLATSCWV